MSEKQRIAGIGCKVIATAAFMVLTASLSGCGQTGSLYLPTESAAEDRATLPRALVPFWPKKKKDEAGEQQPAPASPEPLELSL